MQPLVLMFRPRGSDLRSNMEKRDFFFFFVHGLKCLNIKGLHVVRTADQWRNQTFSFEGGAGVFSGGSPPPAGYATAADY